MSIRQKLIDRIADLDRARDEAFAQGDWDQVDYLQLCIDDTRDTMAKLFNPTTLAAFMQAKGYLATVEGDAVIVQDPVYVSSGTAQGRFVEFKAVTIRTDAEARKFLSDRS